MTSKGLERLRAVRCLPVAVWLAGYHTVQFSLFRLVTPVKPQVVINTVFPGKAGHVGIRLYRQLHKMQFELRRKIRPPTFFGDIVGENGFILLAVPGIEKLFKLLR